MISTTLSNIILGLILFVAFYAEESNARLLRPSPRRLVVSTPMPSPTPAPTPCPMTCISMNSNSLAGAIALLPGESIFGGYNVKIANAHVTTNVTLVTGEMTYYARCGGSTSNATFQAAFSTQSYSIPYNSFDYAPSTSTTSTDTFQTGMIWVPDICGGNPLTFADGAAFSGCFTADQANVQLSIQFHYTPNTTAGAAWSPMQSVTIPNACV